MFTKYSITGLHLDYVRYPSQGELQYNTSYSTYARDAFKAEYEVDPITLTPDDPAWSDCTAWRALQVTNFVARMAEATPSSVVLSDALESADPVKDTDQFMEDFPAWLHNGSLDMVVPEIYTTGTAFVRSASEGLVKLVGTQAFASIGIAPFVGLDPDTLVDQVVATRDAGATGHSQFSWATLTAEDKAALMRSVYRMPAVAPETQSVNAAAALAKDMYRRVNGVYTNGLGMSNRKQLSAWLEHIERDLSTDQLNRVHNDIRQLDHQLENPGIPDPIVQRLQRDLDELRLILDTGKPAGW